MPKQQVDPNMKVELFVQLCINGRPIWIKSKRTKSDSTIRMTDKEYEKVVDAAISELTDQCAKARKLEKELA